MLLWWQGMLKDVVVSKLGDGAHCHLCVRCHWREEHGFSVFLSLPSCMLSCLPETTRLALLSHPETLQTEHFCLGPVATEVGTMLGADLGGSWKQASTPSQPCLTVGNGRKGPWRPRATKCISKRTLRCALSGLQSGANMRSLSLAH